MITVVTSCGPAGFHEYGYRFLDGLAQFWPAEVKVVCYREGQEQHPRAEMRDLFAVPGCKAFLDRHTGSALARGAAPTAVWRTKDYELGYSYRTDALKFCRKVFAMVDAAQRCASGDLLVWIDADVVCLSYVAPPFIPALLGDHDIAYLGRGATHSECGFMIFRMLQCARYLIAFAALYETDVVFALDEWHDSFVFDWLLWQSPELRKLDLTPGGRRHVWCESPLAPYLDHLKGERKKLGRSPERGTAR